MDVHQYWFGADPDAPDIIDQRLPFWFAHPKNRDAIDAHVRAEFGALYERGIRGELNDWTREPRGRLSLIIVLDQFSRNLFREDGRAFAQDAKAFEIMDEAMRRHEDQELRWVERMFFYMPLMHAEALEPQKRALAAYSKLAEDAPEGAPRAALTRVREKAREHLICIERFGRFPHRNMLLQRTSTPEELHFLATEPQPGQGNPGKLNPAFIASRR